MTTTRPGSRSRKAPATPQHSAAKTQPSLARFRSGYPSLRVNTPNGPVEFVDGLYVPADEQVAAHLTRLATERPDLLAKE